MMYMPFSEIAFSDPIRRPKALRLAPIVALGRSARRIFMLAWCAGAHNVHFENSFCSRA